MKNFVLCGIYVVAVLFFFPGIKISNVDAADYYVSDSQGVDTNAGTLGDPFKTIGKGLAEAGPGDTVYVRQGSYDEKIDFSTAGMEDNRITLKGYDAEAVVIQYSRSTGYAVDVDQPYITLENLIIDGGWREADAVKIRTAADYCILKGLEIRNTMRDAVDIDAPDGVLIESCLIHDAIWFDAGQRIDAHGIVTAGVQEMTIRDTEIYYVSGDALQFQYDGWDNVVVENCLLWNGPLPTARGGAPAGVQPGENAIDTKYYTADGRGRLTVNNTIAHGWHSDYISNAAAYNIKHNVEAVFNGTTVYNSEIAFRLRGPASASRGGAWVTVNNAVIYGSDTAVRYEDGIENLHLRHLTLGSGLGRLFQSAGGHGTGFEVLNSLFLAAAKPSEASDPSNMAIDESVFVDAAGHDYRLNAGTAPIDAGVTIAELTTDRDGRLRPQGGGYDIGAYEYPDEWVDTDGDGIADDVDTDDDNDGISDSIEGAHPDQGDGNNDTIADSLQKNVVSLLSYDGQHYVTLESALGTRLIDCQVADNPSISDAPAAVVFSYGFFEFTIADIDPGQSTTLNIYFPADASLETYYKYGPTPDNATGHWYAFLYDGETGAQIDDIHKIITLHFSDAKRGDDILVQDSMVIDIGGPGITSANTTPPADPGGGGGCFINGL